ncbi:hypothetical protein [Candidatus Poriferisodalis sp.]|uniref:hypothetical protein n=1 Tax=Candidatus Poriferisodalis sp. TaxID=3101277 RepID=UPI003B012869
MPAKRRRLGVAAVGVGWRECEGFIQQCIHICDVCDGGCSRLLKSGVASAFAVSAPHSNLPEAMVERLGSACPGSNDGPVTLMVEV